ncbi:hypothetical protein DID76_01760 [Candidatus Marinamargulisbacteria bacterium SCGC AG-414-C22]|nr:hypothetical protein DID76_01760 [Candidatus Marinamargulisbacteria bacterium SCGC AG-414-C22]
MLKTIKSASLLGIDAIEINVEVDCKKGLPTELIVGLPDTVIRESRSRIKAAIKNSGYEYPLRNYTINLAPADLQKEGAVFDLPIAVGLLAVTEQLPTIPNAFFVGELSLNGSVKPIRGIISICELLLQHNYKTIYLPYDNLAEAQLIESINIIPIKHLQDLETQLTKPCIPVIKKIEKQSPQRLLDYSDVKGQELGKRAVEIAAAGKHNLLFIGPPGSGKSMLLKRLPSVLPDLSTQEAIATYKIQSISKQHLQKVPYSLSPPFRSPHHSISYAGMVGGGTKPTPGEISLAHNGVLFLDEVAEFNRQVLEVLRQPIENKCITISRASLSIDYPANFMLVAAMNPCPCGYVHDPVKDCSCTPYQIMQYKKKLSGPIIDRFDLIVEIPRLKHQDFEHQNTNFTSTKMSNNINLAIQQQQQRYQKPLQNGELTPQEIQHYINIEPESRQFLAQLVEKGSITARSFDHIIKVSQTIADLNNSATITHDCVLEALHFRKIVSF